MKKTISKPLDAQTVFKMCETQRKAVDQKHKILQQSLEDSQQDLLFDIVNELDCIGDDQTTQGFVQGFRLAAKLMIDALY